MSPRASVLLLLLLLGGMGIWWVGRGASTANQEEETSGSQEQAVVEPRVSGPAAPTASDPHSNPSPTTPGTLQAGPQRSQNAENSKRNKQAIAELEAGRVREAIELFEQVVDADPEEPVFQQNLAEALVRLALELYDDEPELALANLDRAIELAPARKELLPLRERWNTAVQAQAGFAEDQSTHFILQYDGDRSELLTQGYLEVLDDLERAYQDYGEFFDVFPVEAGRTKFRAVLYDREAFDKVTGIGEWAGGAYDGTIRIPIRNFQRDRNRIRSTLRHELVHAFIEEVGGKQVPGWLNEGLAQYLSENNHANRARALDWSRRRLSGQTLFTLTELQGTLAAISEPGQVAKAYDQSLGFTHWIAEHYGERTLVRMAQAIKNGSTAQAEFQRWIGVDLELALNDFRDSL